MNIETQFKKNGLFSFFSPKEIEKIISLAISRRFLKGEFVIHEADVWPYLLYVHKGQFQALKESTGRTFVIEDFKPGDYFWGLALFETGEPNPVAIKAAKNGELLLWHKTQVEAMINDNPQVAWGLFNLMAIKMRRVGNILDELAFQPLTGRLANLLIDQFKGAQDDVIARDLTLDDMAARIGTTREMVCKILYRFADQGVLDIQRTALKINDRLKLREIAGKTKG